ncbi:MAG: acyl carrier protein [Candidatus Nitrosotenuis sp.]|nr:MAG: acyl carrier protein [Candidatus Nitrosotenuis sp.]
MADTRDEQLKHEIKTMIIKTCRLNDFTPETIADDQPLVGPDSPLGLDSLDMMELSVELKNRYGVKIMDMKDAMRMMKSINALVESIQAVR